MFVTVGLLQASRDAPAVDEAVGLTAGLVAVENRDLRMNPEHGVVPHVLSALLPVLFAEPVVPTTDAYENGAWFDYTADLLGANVRAGQLDDVLFWSRVAPVLVGALTGVALHRLASSIFGPGAGLVAGGLWLTSPYVVGLAHLGGLDVWYSAALVILALALVRYERNRRSVDLVLVAAAIGLAMLVRHQSVLLLGPVLVLVAMRSRSTGTALRQIGIVVVVPLVLVGIVHRAVDPVPVQGAPAERFEAIIEAASDEGPAVRAGLHAPLPFEWRAGAGYLVLTSDPRPAYLIGEHWTGGRPWYLAASAAVKLPLTTWVLIGAGLAGMRHVSANRRRIALVALGGAFGVHVVFIHLQPLNLGLRFAVPLLAAGCVVAGAAVRPSLTRRRAGLLAIAIVAQGLFFLAAHPYSLAWTPPPFSDGYRLVSDSSVDIGQGLNELSALHERKPLVAATLTRPRGFDPLDGVPAIDEVPADELVGAVAVSATVLTVSHFEELSWLRAYCPVGVVARSILLYHFEEPPDRSPGPSWPERPCDGESSRRADRAERDDG